jgi:hypothetical protein
MLKRIWEPDSPDSSQTQTNLPHSSPVRSIVDGTIAAESGADDLSNAGIFRFASMIFHSDMSIRTYDVKREKFGDAIMDHVSRRGFRTDTKLGVNDRLRTYVLHKYSGGLFATSK